MSIRFACLLALWPLACGGPQNEPEAVAALSGSGSGSGAASVAVVLPGGEAGVGFDDLLYSPDLRRVVAPGGRTGVIALVDPRSGAVDSIEGFSKEPSFNGGHDFGVTSVDVGRGLLFATDRTTRLLHVIDPTTKKIVSSTPLGAGPDYVRYVAKTDEVWVAEPSSDRIEVFSLSKGPAPVATSVANIAIDNGPESLVIDEVRGRAYTHRWDSTTLSIDVTTRAVVAEWKNGCLASRGIALDAARGFLFAVCNEGKVSVLDATHDGAVLGTATHGGGFDVVGYDAAMKHLYAAGGSCKCLTVFAVHEDGAVSPIAERPAMSGTHCAVADGSGHAWICDPKSGALVRYADDE